MARLTKALTNTQVKQAKPKEKEFSLSDGDGLALRIKPNGTKQWIFNYYRPFSKKRANISFGQYPQISLADARKQREAARAQIAKDIDPKTHRDETTQQKQDALANNFGKVAEKWYELKKQKVKEDTATKAWNIMNKHVFPQLENTPIHLIKPKMVIDILQPLANKGILETVKRLCCNVNEVMRLAVASGLIEVNYLADITKLFPAPKKQNMVTIKPERLPELMKALNQSNITKNTRCLVEWQLHTMTRPIEAATAKWVDIDVDAKVWVIPAERMKMKKPHTIPLTPQTLALLEYVRSINGATEYVFPSHRDRRGHANSQSANMAIKRIGFAGELVSHGLRALASTTLNEQGFDPDVVEAALAHVDHNEVRRAYNRAEYIERRRVMMCWWSEHIEKASTGNMSMASGVQGLRVVGG